MPDPAVLTDTLKGQLVLWLIISIPSLLVALDRLVALKDKLMPRPSDMDDMSKRFVTHSDLVVRDAKIDAIKERQDDLSRSLRDLTVSQNQFVKELSKLIGAHETPFNS